MVKKFIIKGGSPLTGTVKISGAKNAAIKEIAASLLTTEPLFLENVPQISDVGVDLEIVKALGVAARVSGDSVTLKSSQKLKTVIPKVLSKKSRASVITLGPLLAREGRVVLTAPGGCDIGKRPLDRHLAALESLGAQFTVEGSRIEGQTGGLRGGRIVFAKNTVMGTENALLASVLAKGETEIVGAAQEPEVDDLISLLSKMGARIERDERNPRTIRIQGVQSLGGAKHRVLPDRNEAVTIACAAAATRGNVTLEGVEPEHLTFFLDKLKKVGVSFEAGESSLRIWVDPNTEFLPVDLETSPHPGFMTDWQQPMTLLLTQVKGESLVHEAVYEDRWKYLSELSKFGANVELFTPSELGKTFDPKKVNFDWKGEGEPKTYAKVKGPVVLEPAVAEITDLRAGATLVLAALAAKGESEIYGAEQVERGYENFEKKLTSLGAEIKKEG